MTPATPSGSRAETARSRNLLGQPPFRVLLLEGWSNRLDEAGVARVLVLAGPENDESKKHACPVIGRLRRIGRRTSHGRGSGLLDAARGIRPACIIDVEPAVVRHCFEMMFPLPSLTSALEAGDIDVGIAGHATEPPIGTEVQARFPLPPQSSSGTLSSSSRSPRSNHQRPGHRTP